MQQVIEMQQGIEHRRQIRQVRFKVDCQSMKQLFTVTHHCQHRKGGLNYHPFIPSAFGTQLQVLGRASRAAEAQIGQGDAVAILLFN